jgi:hypothetical protein
LQRLPDNHINWQTLLDNHVDQHLHKSAENLVFTQVYGAFTFPQIPKITLLIISSSSLNFRAKPILGTKT